jgi:predicted DNA-binding protein
MNTVCIRLCVTKILTVRLPVELHQKAEARALRLGLDRAKYVRSLIKGDVSEAARNAQSTFASENLVGLYEVGVGSASNASVRQRWVG